MLLARPTLNITSSGCLVIAVIAGGISKVLMLETLCACVAIVLGTTLIGVACFLVLVLHHIHTNTSTRTSLSTDTIRS